MGPKNIFHMFEEIIGKRCRIETVDGTVLYETIHSVGCREIAWPGGLDGKVSYPQILYYNELETEGADLSILQSIEVDEPAEEGSAA